jgi:hypothetical protein
MRARDSAWYPWRQATERVDARDSVGLQGVTRILVTRLTPALGRRYQTLLTDLAAQ